MATARRRADDWLPLANLLAEMAWFATAAALILPWADNHIPSQDLPWKPLDIRAAPGLFTHDKLNAIEGEDCREIIGQVATSVQTVPDRTQQGFCRIEDAVRVSPTRLAPAAPVMVCRQAAAYLIWERQVLQPLAREMLGSPVARVEHYGTYACRRQYGAREGRVSEHALANAIDIAGVVLRDGRRITVAGHWDDRGPRGEFIRAVRDGACGVFDVVLSPDYNAAHRDHLHLDMGAFRTCR